MSLLKEIRKQPHHIRATFMWLCVVITGSIVGYVGFGMAGREFVAMVNPEAEQRRNFAKQQEQKDNPPSAFATVNDAMANIGRLLGIHDEQLPAYENESIRNNSTPTEPRLFPQGGERKK